jgi:DNA-binding GntR family transcriptional regulator
MTSELVARDLWQSVYDQLREEIVTGELAPGSRLVETELAERFATSRGPVRTALKELEGDGLVVVNPRRGTFVLPVSTDDVDEIFSLYAALWPLAMRRAVARVAPDDLARLRSQIDIIDASRDDTGRWTSANFDFHRMIIEMSHHRRLLQIWDSLQAQVQMLASVLTDADPGDLRETINLHPAIYKAMEKGDADAAERVVQRYIRQMRKLLHVPEPRR